MHTMILNTIDMLRLYVIDTFPPDVVPVQKITIDYKPLSFDKQSINPSHILNRHFFLLQFN